MNIVKLKVGIDIDDPKQMEAMNSFLTDLRGLKAEEVQITGKIADTVKKEPAKQEVAKTTETATTSKNEEAKADAPAAINPGGGKGIDYIRKLIGLKSGTHRQAMKDKLTELGAASATELTVDKYEEMTTFLEGLSD